MPEFNQVYTYTVPNGGGTINLDVTDSTTTRYVFSGTPTLSSSFTIQPTGSPTQGTEFDIRWQSVCTQGANTVTIFGRALSDDEALSDLTVTCYYNGTSWDVDVVNNDLVIDTDSPVPFRGLKRVDSGDSSSLAVGIVDTSGFKTINSYSNSGNTLTNTVYTQSTGAGISCNNTSTDTSGSLSITPTSVSMGYSRDVSDELAGNISFLNFNDGLIGVFETKVNATSNRYGFSTHNNTGATQADFYEYNPTVDLDTKYIWITPDGIMGKVLYDIVDDENYSYNTFNQTEDGFSVGLAGTVVAGVDTAPTSTFKVQLTAGIFNIQATLGNYANDAAAAAAGIPVGSLYHNAGAVRIRLV